MYMWRCPYIYFSNFKCNEKFTDCTYVGTYNEIFPALCFFTVKQATSRIRRLDGAGQLMT
jgi:hypothetical protein